MLIRLLLGLALSLPVGATVFQMQPVNQQIKEADGIVIGHYLRSKTIELDDGSLATQMIFKMKKEYGLQSELFGMDEVIIHYPGGQLGERRVHIEGVPQFVPGENVVIMIHSRQDRYWGHNLGFGTFKIINYGNETLVVNTIFPNNRNVGQIRLADFEKSIRAIKGSSMKVVLTPQYPTEKDSSMRAPASIEEGKNRAIASNADQVDNEDTQPQFNTLWLVFFLAVLGGLFRLSRQKSN